MMSAETDDALGHTADDDLDRFEFDVGDQFVLWRPQAGGPACDAAYYVFERQVLGSADAANRASRCYTLACRERETGAVNEVYLTGEELKNDPRWRPAGDIEDGGRR